jgi:hypothetical protein
MPDSVPFGRLAREDVERLEVGAAPETHWEEFRRKLGSTARHPPWAVEE